MNNIAVRITWDRKDVTYVDYVSLKSVTRFIHVLENDESVSNVIAVLELGINGE